MRLKDPVFLLLIIFALPMVWVYIRRERRSRAALRFSDLSVIGTLPRSALIRWRHCLIVLRVAALILLTIALARPQKGRSGSEVTTEGVDIMLILDISNSMHCLDFAPDNRITVAKRTMQEFIAKRPSDRIGLVVFGGRAYTKCPLTLDHDVLSRLVSEIDFADFSEATAIGTAIATAANRLVNSSAKSKVIILATDGDNNAGDIPPLTAAAAAKELGIKIYAVGIGRPGQVPMPMEMQNPLTGQIVEQTQMVESDLNEQLLANIADMTGGKSFRATDANKFRAIYDQIDKMEKTVIRTKIYSSFDEKFYAWLWAGFILLLLEFLLHYTRFRRIP
jgi:Ca-activated chloride channel family protein